MKTTLSLSLSVASLLLLVSIALAAPTPLYVKVRTTKLRAKPQQWAPAVSNLSYGDRLTLLSKEGAWKKVQFGNRKGYIHDSALSERRIVLKASKSVSGGDDRDVILAGKGFNKEVEKGYAAKSGLNYAAVNAMEKITVSDSELATFAKTGQLQGGK